MHASHTNATWPISRQKRSGVSPVPITPAIAAHVHTLLGVWGADAQDRADVEEILLQFVQSRNLDFIVHVAIQHPCDQGFLTQACLFMLRRLHANWPKALEESAAFKRLGAGELMVWIEEVVGKSGEVEPFKERAGRQWSFECRFGKVKSSCWATGFRKDKGEVRFRVVDSVGRKGFSTSTYPVPFHTGGEGDDISLQCDDGAIVFCHRSIVSVQSPILADMLETTTKGGTGQISIL